LSARLRYFDPVRRGAGVPDDVGALVSELRDDRTVVTLLNVSPTTPRTVVVQSGGYGEHQILSAEVNGRTTPISARDITVQLAPGAGAKLTLAMKRYANPPTAKSPGTDRARSPHRVLFRSRQRPDLDGSMPRPVPRSDGDGAEAMRRRSAAAAKDPAESGSARSAHRLRATVPIPRQRG